MSRLIPREPVPMLEVPLVDGGSWRLDEQSPGNFTLIAFYRGLHCPICKSYVKELDNLVANFAARGVGTLVLSSDDEARAAQARDDWGLSHLTIGHNLSIEQARAWGLYISASRGKTSLGIEEPALFSEPGLFLVRPDNTLYWGTTSTMPFARPHFREILGAVDFVLKNDYPARGEA